MCLPAVDAGHPFGAEHSVWVLMAAKTAAKYGENMSSFVYSYTSNSYLLIHFHKKFGVKGIVHPKMKSWYVSAYPPGHPRCGWLPVSRTQTKFFLKSVSHVMAVNGTHGFESKKNIHRQNQVKPCGLWRYIEVLIIARIVYTSDQAVVNAFRTVGHCGGSGVKLWYKHCAVSCTDRLFCVLRPQCIITSRRV